MHTSQHTYAALFALSTLLCVLFTTHDAHAQRRGAKPEDVFKNTIALTERPFPARFKDEKAFVHYVRKAKTNEIIQDEEGKPWKVYYMAFFSKKLNQRNYTIVFYDITNPKRPTVVTRNNTTSLQSGFRITSGEYDLEENLFKPEHKYLMVYTKDERKAPLAEVEFVLRAPDPKKLAAKAKRLKKLEAEAKKTSSSATKKEPSKPRWVPPDW